MRDRNVLRASFVFSLALISGFAAGACDESTTSTPAPDAASVDATAAGDAASASDGATGTDAALGKDAYHPTPAPDGGPNPTFACITDGGFPCPIPPSECIDDYWLRFYQNGMCVDGGCVFQAQNMLCEPGFEGAEPPFCTNGTCKIVIVR